MVDYPTVIINAVVTLIIVSLIGTLIIAYLGTSSPILYMNPPSWSQDCCYPNEMDFGEGYKYELYVSNRGETPAISKVCFYGDNLTFTEGGTVGQNGLCYSERVVAPKAAELVQKYQPQIRVNNSKKINNVTLRVEASCSYKILSFISKACEPMRCKCSLRNVGGGKFQLRE
jgi:hypothetical protein